MICFASSKMRMPAYVSFASPTVKPSVLFQTPHTPSRAASTVGKSSKAPVVSDLMCQQGVVKYVKMKAHTLSKLDVFLRRKLFGATTVGVARERTYRIW